MITYKSKEQHGYLNILIILAGGLKDGAKLISLTSSGAQEVTNLQCRQEEADTRIIFHAVKVDLPFKENCVKGS